jgi:hypothetical protein
MKNNEVQHTESGNSPPEQSELEVAVTAAYTDWKNAVASARKTTLEFARELGGLLIQMKSETDHGNWLPALQRCGLSIRKAQRFMRVAGADASTLSHLASVHQVEQALATPKPVPEDIYIPEDELCDDDDDASPIPIPDYHHRHHAENRRKVRAVNPELADKVEAGEVTLRDAMKQTKSARIRQGRAAEKERIALEAATAKPGTTRAANQEIWRTVWKGLGITEADVKLALEADAAYQKYGSGEVGRCPGGRGQAVR